MLNASFTKKADPCGVQNIIFFDKRDCVGRQSLVINYTKGKS